MARLKLLTDAERKARHAESQRRYYAANRERELSRMKKWYEENAEKKNTADAERRARGNGAGMSWESMRTRCLNPNSTQYEQYGARGLRLCARWESFELFLEDVGPRPDGHTLDRINNDLGYSPGNVKWSTPKEQAANRRPRRKPMGKAATNRPQVEKAA